MTATKVFYARVSTDDQKLDLQMDAGIKAGCTVFFKEKGQSGSKRSRPELDKCLASLKEGDTLCVWRLDRLGRSLSHLISIVEDLKNRKVHFESITERIDTNTPLGMLVFHIFSAFAEFERATIIERVNAGLAAAKKRGTKLGRRFFYNPDQIVKGKVSKSTFYRRRNKND